MFGTTLRTAWRNLGRNRRRTGLTLGAIAVAQTAVLVFSGMINGFGDSTLETVTGPIVGHAQIHAHDWREERATEMAIDDVTAKLAAIRALPGVDSAFARVYAPALVASEMDGHGAMILGVDLDAETGPGGLLEGIAPEALDGEHPALIGAAFARDTGMEVGDELAVVGSASDGSIAADLVTITGLIETPLDMINRGGLIVGISVVQEAFLLEDSAHEITVRGADPGAADALVASLSTIDGLDELEILTWQEVAPEMSQILEVMGVYGYIVMIIVFMAAAAGVANTMLMSTFERRRELGMLLALGSGPGRLLRMVLTEALLLGLLGVAVGTVVGGALVLYWSEAGMDVLMGGGASAEGLAMFGVGVDPYVYPFLTVGNVVAGFIGIAVVSVVAAFLPALGTARLEPVEAMRG